MVLYSGHLTRFGGVDPHNSPKSASPTYSEHFQYKIEKIA